MLVLQVAIASCLGSLISIYISSLKATVSGLRRAERICPYSYKMIKFSKITYKYFIIYNISIFYTLNLTFSNVIFIENQHLEELPCYIIRSCFQSSVFKIAIARRDTQSPVIARSPADDEAISQKTRLPRPLGPPGATTLESRNS